MYCEVAPSHGGSTLRWPANAGAGAGAAAANPALELVYPAGATLFYSTRTAIALAPPELMARAKRMVCVYSAGFGRVEEGQYPAMAPSGLVSTTPAPDTMSEHKTITEPAKFKSLENYAFDGGGAGSVGDGDGDPGQQPSERLYNGVGALRQFRHALIQRDETGAEYALVHGLCLDHLVEHTGKDLADQGGTPGTPLSWNESVRFIESLLAPAARPPHLLALGWEPGDVAIWDNRTTQHSVTPTHSNCGDPGYAALGERRLMTRTAMQPSWLPTARPLGEAVAGGPS